MREQLAGAQDQIRILQDRTTFVEGRLRVCDLLGQVLRLSEAAAARNCGEAATLSSPFFDAVGREAALTDQPVVRAARETILRTRDHLTTAIAQSDPSLTATRPAITLGPPAVPAPRTASRSRRAAGPAPTRSRS